VQIRDRFVLKTNQYHLVFANILYDALILEKEILLQSLKSKGYLIVSGLLKTQLEEFKKDFHDSDLTIVDEQILNDWGCLVFIKR